ncbi:MAG: BlaI/MecI/CopY family transcriptional regulator [Clostridia bacterium]|nr:BlaI/MecI/CopY family transcriptional regulator [Clostridia bacterium]
MNENSMGMVESRFADIVWANAPVRSGDLVKICEKELNWKKPTTYTVLRRLCERGLFRNENGTVEPVVTREEYYAAKTDSVINEGFHGSLPAFINAFVSTGRISQKDADEIRRIISEYKAD